MLADRNNSLEGDSEGVEFGGVLYSYNNRLVVKIVIYKPKFAILSMSKVEIYHTLGRKANIDKLLAEGLKSAKQLIDEGVLEDYSNGLFGDHINNIYFQWFPPHLESNKESTDWVSIEVDSELTDVYNREFRFHRDIGKYNASRMKLSKYISQHEKTDEMREQVKPGQIIIWNPITAEPMIVSVDDRRVNDYTCQYLNEILVPELIIPPSEFAGYNKAKVD